MQIEVGHIRTDEWDQQFRIASEAFNGPRKIPRKRVLQSEDNVLAARSNGELVGVAGVADFGQVFDGVVLPMGGVTAVAVAPEATGQGVARRLMTELLRLMGERGHVVSLLSPSTSTLYRSVGYEHASMFIRRQVPLRNLRDDPPEDVIVERAGVEVFDDHRDLHEAHARRSHGWLIRDDWYWKRKAQAVAASDTHVRVYVARRGERTLAVAAVQHEPTTTYPLAHYDLSLLDIFGEPDGLTAIAASLRGHSTVAGYLHTTMSYADLPSITRVFERCDPTLEDPMMGRIVDLPEAVRARGGGHFTGDIHLRVHDDVLATNNGDFVVSMSEDMIGIERGGSGEIELSIGDLASVFSGYQSPTTLAAYGRLGNRADTAAINRMSRWLNCPTPTVVDGF